MRFLAGSFLVGRNEEVAYAVTAQTPRLSNMPKETEEHILRPMFRLLQRLLDKAYRNGNFKTRQQGSGLALRVLHQSWIGCKIQLLNFV